MKKTPSGRNINFRETNSERSATNSYRSFGKYLKERFRGSLKNLQKQK